VNLSQVWSIARGWSGAQHQRRGVGLGVRVGSHASAAVWRRWSTRPGNSTKDSRRSRRAPRLYRQLHLFKVIHHLSVFRSVAFTAWSCLGGAGLTSAPFFINEENNKKRKNDHYRGRNNLGLTKNMQRLSSTSSVDIFPTVWRKKIVVWETCGLAIWESCEEFAFGGFRIHKRHNSFVASVVSAKLFFLDHIFSF